MFKFVNNVKTRETMRHGAISNTCVFGTLLLQTGRYTLSGTIKNVDTAFLKKHMLHI
jgi:hypothetical protein